MCTVHICLSVQVNKRWYIHRVVQPSLQSNFRTLYHLEKKPCAHLQLLVILFATLGDNSSTFLTQLISISLCFLLRGGFHISVTIIYGLWKALLRELREILEASIPCRGIVFSIVISVRILCHFLFSLWPEAAA